MTRAHARKITRAMGCSLSEESRYVRSRRRQSRVSGLLEVHVPAPLLADLRTGAALTRATAAPRAARAPRHRAARPPEARQSSAPRPRSARDRAAHPGKSPILIARAPD